MGKKKPAGNDLVEQLFAAIEKNNVKLEAAQPVYDECVDLDAPYPGSVPPADALDANGNLTQEWADKLTKDEESRKP